jgi:hypothetical protein
LEPTRFRFHEAKRRSARTFCLFRFAAGLSKTDVPEHGIENTEHGADVGKLRTDVYKQQANVRRLQGNVRRFRSAVCEHQSVVCRLCSDVRRHCTDVYCMDPMFANIVAMFGVIGPMFGNIDSDAGNRRLMLPGNTSRLASAILKTAFARDQTGCRASVAGIAGEVLADRQQMSVVSVASPRWMPARCQFGGCRKAAAG